jgi:hypothetical protein
MSPPVQRSFSCHSCQGTIYIPFSLPPTTAPCPHCGIVLRSPAAETSPATLPSPRKIQPIPGTQEEPAPVKIPIVFALPEEDAEEPTAPSKTPWAISTFLLLLLTAAALLFYRELIQPHEKPQASPVAPITKPTRVSSFQWQPQARELLQKFFAARTPEAKARCVIGGLATVERLQASWGKSLLEEAPLDPDDFAAIVTDATDPNPSVFLMIYERPALYDMKKFLRPLVTMEVMQGIETLDPLTKSLTAPENFELPPLMVQAYMKLVDGQLMLDYDIYLQTRHRTLQRFAESAAPGTLETFRLILEEDIPLARESQSGEHIYRVTDPIHTTDSFRVFAADQARFASKLSSLHWHGVPNAKILHRPATVTLTKRENQRIEITDFVCWEFLGLEKPSTDAPTEPDPLPDASPLPPDP